MAVNILLQNLQHEPLDSHGRAIVDTLHLCVDKEIPSLGKYMTSRFL